ncbi:hypothetical protein HN873_061009 [Arachis hypogaea]
MISTAVSPAIAIAVSAIVAAVVAASKASESSHYFRSVFSFELSLLLLMGNVFAGWGTDEGLIIKILSHRNLAQRELICAAYASAHGEDLLTSLDKELSTSSSGEYETSGSTTASAFGLPEIMAAKSMEFSYQELAKATNNFSSDNKIGQKAAIKKMDVQASTEFLSELKVLTHVYHLNLIEFLWHSVNLNLTLINLGAFDWILRRGISFLVYEYIENGNLGQYLHGTVPNSTFNLCYHTSDNVGNMIPRREPLAWSTRVQIALDSPRGLEYIHEHTIPVYIHRDVKPANILIYKDFHGKVKAAIWQGRRSMPVNGYEARAIMALLQCAETLEQHWWSSLDLSLVATTSSSKFGRESFIDLNLPAPAEQDDASQFEDSVVSDAEFVNPVKVFPR